jgi:histidinol-phosphate aminotransferase
MIAFTPLIASLPATVPFVGPEAITRRTGVAVKARIGANENAHGPSPAAIAAMQAAVPGAWAYGDPEVYDLRLAIAKFHHVGVENVSVGEGIDGLFGHVVRMFIEPGTPVATSEGAYPTFNFHVTGFGGRLVTTPYVHDKESPSHLIDLARRENAKLIYFANPDNPMGTSWSAAIVHEMISRVPEGSLLLLDEAYTDFAPGTAPPLDVNDTRVLRFRTFSKAYGMAGVRVGYVLGHPAHVAAFDKIRNHFGVTRIGQAGAMAALADQAYIAEVVRRNEAGREMIYATARANGLHPIPSSTNFVALDCGRDGAYARKVVEALASHGVFVRMPGVAPLNRCIRVTVGTEENLRLFAEVLPAALQTAGASSV